MGPDIDDLVISFIVGNETEVIVVHDIIHLGCGIGNQFGLDLRNDDVIQVEGETSLESHAESKIFDVIEEFCCFGSSGLFQYLSDDIS